MSKSQTDIVDVFSIFHDGGITTWKQREDILELTVDCKYLAELINPKFEKFRIELNKVNKLELYPWMNPFDLPKREIKETKDIFAAELEILSAEAENGCVKISCNQHDTDYDYCGGNLLLSAESILVKDESGKELSIEELDRICRQYWDAAKDANRKRIESKK